MLVNSCITGGMGEKKKYGVRSRGELIPVVSKISTKVDSIKVEAEDSRRRNIVANCSSYLRESFLQRFGRRAPP